MTVLLTLLAVAAASWVFRIAFTALVAVDRLPTAVRVRMDVVGAAAFAALLTTELAGTSRARLPVMLLAVVAAAIAKRLTRNHLAAVAAAAVAWTLMSVW